MQNVNNKGNYVQGGRGIWEFSVCSAQSSVNLKLNFKIVH